MERVVRMMKTADFNPHFFDWPSLTTYMQLLLACLSFLWGAMHGSWSSLDQVTAGDFYVAGRCLSALLGTATVLLTYFAARRWGDVTAAVAAALMAVMPLHVRESHYVLTDVPTTFFTTLALLMSLRAAERQTAGAFAWAGVAAGLAASCKYNGAIAMVMPLIAVAVSGPWTTILSRLMLVGGAAAGGFLLGTPYALLDLPAFLNDYARLAAIFARDRGGEPGWSIYLKHLRGSLGWPGLLFAGVGGAIGLGRLAFGPDRARWPLLLVFPLIYFAVMATSYRIFGRYMLPLLPFACVLAAIGLTEVTSAFKRLPVPRTVGAIGTLILLVVTLSTPVSGAVAFNRDLGKTTTVDRAYRWIRANLAPGTKIAIETQALLLPASRYPSINVGKLVEKPYEEYKAESFAYLVASTGGYETIFQTPPAPADPLAAYRQLLAHATEVAAFAPSDTQPGPPIRIFKLE
jgi:hypothetical protein